jgi:hypothetical protein
MPDEVHSSGDYPSGPSLEARVSAVEARLARVEAAIDSIQKELQAIRVDIAEMRAEMRGRLTNIPTTFQLIYMQTAFVAAIFAASFALLKFAAPS